MQTISLTQLNTITSDPASFQKFDDDFSNSIRAIAKSIQKNANEKPIILLSGPSGSGKTTIAYWLERFLDGWDITTHTVSMDNFFRTMTPEQKILAADGKLDLESPNRVDIPYLNQQLHKIISDEPTWIPKYHFSTAMRNDHDWLLTRKPRELLILEGIHALNSDVITIPDHQTHRIYVSTRTRIVHNDITLHPSRLRLLRRMIQDQKFRQRSILETLAMFQHVEAGGKKEYTSV